MAQEPLLYRTDLWVITLLLFGGMVALWEAAYLAGARARARARGKGMDPDLASMETAAGGLLALILAFSFTMAAQRFDRRQETIVEEANAIDTGYRRCALLGPVESRSCQDKLRRYIDQRVELFEARRDRIRVEAALAQAEELQRSLWREVVPEIRAADTPSRALLLVTLNRLIDLNDQRAATLREIVPDEVTELSLLLCLGWAGFTGFAHGVRANRRRVAWMGFAALISVVVHVTLDLDRPNRGLGPLAGESVMLDVQNRLWADGPGPHAAAGN
jgi:hypothetical protein